ncbi:MAG: restriction endonuclease subunit S, partial [Anaerolineae bacterium]
QRRIVDAIEAQFSRLDVAVATLERAQANLKRYKAAVLQAACEGRLVPTEAELAREEGRDYEPAEVLLERILAERRRKWEEARWAELVERAKKKAAQAERKAAGLPYYLRELPEASWVDRPEEEYAPYLPKGDRWKAKYEEPEPPDTEGLPELPEGWVWARAEQLIEFSQNGISKRHSELGSPTTVLRLADIVNGNRIDLANIRKIRLVQDEVDKYRLAKGDLLCIRVNGSPDLVGRFIPFFDADLPIAFCDHFIRFRLVNPELVEPIAAFLHSDRVRKHVELHKVSSAGQNTVSQGTMESVPIPLPPLAEQRRIADELARRASLVEDIQGIIQASWARAGRLRQSILKRAFEGRLVPQDPDDEWVSSDCEAARADPHNADVVQDRLPGM